MGGRDPSVRGGHGAGRGRPGSVLGVVYDAAGVLGLRQVDAALDHRRSARPHGRRRPARRGVRGRTRGTAAGHLGLPEAAAVAASLGDAERRLPPSDEIYAAAGALVAEMLERVRLRGLGGRRVDEPSGGQEQRVAVARALVLSPRVLLPGGGWPVGGHRRTSTCGRRHWPRAGSSPWATRSPDACRRASSLRTTPRSGRSLRAR